MTENLKDYIQKLVELEKEEEKYKNIFSNIKIEKNKLTDSILNFMEQNDIKDKDIIYGDKKIKYSTIKVQDCITKKLIEERLKVFLKNESQAHEATNFIYTGRNSSNKNFIKITNIKTVNK
jgi:hypothetical protein